VMQTPRSTEARILIVDDERVNVVLLERILQQAGYTNVKSTTDSTQAAALYDEFEPDLILLDLHMPGLDGFAVMEQLDGRIKDDDFLPILILTADIRPEIKRRALSAGAKDFVTKPFDRTEVLLRIQNLLETRYLYLRLDRQAVREGQAI
jgi:putative two-component system response regulator